MKIILSSSISHYRDQLRFEEFPDCRNAAASIFSSVPTGHWLQLSQAAKLVADAYEWHDPDFRGLKERDLGEDFGGIIDGDSKSRLKAVDRWYARESTELSRERRAFFDRFFEKLNLAAPFQSEFLFLSPDPVINHLYLRKRRFLDGSTILGMLAIAGISTHFPAVSFLSDEDLEMVRSKLETERRAYLSALSKFVSECHTLMVEGQFKDLYQYASIHTNIEIHRQLLDLENSIRKLDKKLLRRIKIGVVSDGIPALGGFFLNPVDGLGTLAHSVLEILCKAFAERDITAEIKQEFPLAAYVYELKRVSA